MARDLGTAINNNLDNNTFTNNTARIPFALPSGNDFYGVDFKKFALKSRRTITDTTGTLAATDVNNVVAFNNSANTITFTIPNSTTLPTSAWPIDGECTFVNQGIGHVILSAEQILTGSTVIDTFGEITLRRLSSSVWEAAPSAEPLLYLKNPCRLASTENLDATYDNGTNGVSATLTMNANGLLNLDGVNVAAEDIVLIWQQTDAAENGIYLVAVPGDGSTAAVLIRASYYHIASQIRAGDQILIITGDNYAHKIFCQTQTSAITMGTTDINFSIVNPPSQIKSYIVPDDYTVTALDSGNLLYTQDGAPNVINIETNAVEAIPVNSWIIIENRNLNSSFLNITAAGGVTLYNGVSTSTSSIILYVGQSVKIIKTGTDEWYATTSPLPAQGDTLALVELQLNNQGLRVKDTNNSHFLDIRPIMDLSSDTVWSIDTGTTSKTFTQSADATIGGNTVVAATTYTPTVGDGTNNFTLTTANGWYHKIGAFVHFSLRCIWNSKGSASGNIRVSLPFAALTSGYRAAFTVGPGAGVTWQQATEETMLTAVVDDTNQYALLVSSQGDGGTGVIITAALCAAAGEIQLAGTYRTSA